jgi:hypothetical protein
MKNETKKQVENINNSNEKLLLSDVSKSVCDCSETDRVEEDGELYCIKCGSKWD